jgi:hypothetical protein
MPVYTRIERTANAFQQPVELEQILDMCQRAFGEMREVIAVRELGGGGFNNIYRVEMAGMQPVILRVAPQPKKLTNTCGATLMRIEIFIKPLQNYR